MNLFTVLKWIIKPAWRVTTWLFELLAKRTLLPILRQSDEVYWDRCRWQNRWEPLLKGVEFKLVRRAAHEEPSLSRSCLYIRNTGQRTLDRIDLSAVARLDLLEKPSDVVFRAVAPGTVQLHYLPDFPIEDLCVVRGKFFSTYDSFFIRVHQVVLDGEVDSRRQESLCAHPTHFSLLNGSRVVLFGRVWNTNAVEDIMQEMDDRLRWRFIGSRKVFGRDSLDLFEFALRHRVYSALIFIAIYSILRNRALLGPVCWLSLILRIKKIAPFQPMEIG